MTSHNGNLRELTDGGILSPRLKAVCDMIGRVGEDIGTESSFVLADIGTDHGKLPIQCVEDGVCSFVYAADLREGPLASAKKNISLHGISEDKIKTVLSDGLDSVPQDYDCVSIAGMGGLLIADIVDRRPKDAVFVLSPMSSIEDLRKWLYERSFSITDERVAREDRRLYTVMRAEKSCVPVSYTLFDCYFSAPMRDRYEEDKEIRDYLDYIISQMKKIVAGQEKSPRKTESYTVALSIIAEGEKFIDSMR